LLFDKTVNSTAIRFVIVLVVTVGLAGCGFRLAGTANLPRQLSSIYLQTSGFDKQQQDALRLQLSRAGAELKNQDDPDSVKLAVSLKVLPDRRLVSSARNGSTVERLARSLDFSLRAVDGEMLVPTRTLVQQNDIVLDDDNLLASSKEKASVLEDLHQALFEQLIRQLKRI
jgi:LPS-assembly lipoprotein